MVNAFLTNVFVPLSSVLKRQPSFPVTPRKPGNAQKAR